MVLFLDIAILKFKMYQQMEEKSQNTLGLIYIDEQYALRCVEVEYKLVDKWKVANMF